MRKGSLRSLRLASGLVVLAGYLALASVQHYGPAILLVPLIFLPLAPLGEWLHARYAFYARVTTWCNILCLVVIIPVGVLRLSRLDAVVALVIYVHIYLLMHRKRTRDYYYLYLMAFFLLLAACASNGEVGMGVAMVLFLASAAWAFVSLQVYAEGLASPTGGLLEEDMEHAERSGLAVATAAVAALALLLTLGFFVAAPRFEAGLFGQNDAAQFRSGLDSTINVAKSGRLVPDITPVMSVEFPDEPDGRYNGPLFWRASTLDAYADGLWTRRDIPPNFNDRTPRLVPRNGTPANSNHQNVVVRNPTNTGRLVHQIIFTDNAPDEGIPCLALVQRVQVVGDPKDVKLSWDGMGDCTVVMARQNGRRLHYEVWSEVEDFSPGQLREAPDTYAAVIAGRDYALLTYSPLGMRTSQLVQDLTRDQPTVYDKVVAIERWLRETGGFTYSIDLPALSPDHAIDDFLLETKRGHCELFATAMALMLRDLDIPTRVVSGYRGGEWSAADRSYVVRASMAHLWVEVYFVDIGWVSFDPTPATQEIPGLMTGRFGRFLTRYLLKTKMRWYSDVIAYDQGLQIKALRRFRLRLAAFHLGPSSREGEPRSAERRLPQVSLTTFLAVFATGVLGYAAVRLRGRRRRGPRYLLTADQARAVRLYRHLCGKLARFGMDCRGRTAEEIAEDLAARPDIDGTSALEILAVYNAARFGARTLDSVRCKALRQSLRRLRTIKPDVASS